MFTIFDFRCFCVTISNKVKSLLMGGGKRGFRYDKKKKKKKKHIEHETLLLLDRRIRL